MRNAIITVFLIASIALFAAPVENLLSFQGKIVESGVPVDGTRNITFRLYDVAAGGTPLWQESHVAVPVAGGLFNVELGGSVNFAGAGVSFDEQYWIGISVGGGAKITPRYKLTSAPYSMNSVWEINGSDIYYDSGKVGIGTETPVTELDVIGDIRATGKIRPDEYTQNGVPICYGMVAGDGTLTHGTSNITSVTWEAAYNQYKINITEGFNFSRNAWVVTPY